MYAIRDAEGRFVGRARSRAAAHRRSRRANMVGLGDLNLARGVRVELYDVWADGRLLYSGVNQSEARRTFVSAAIPDLFQFARALGLGQPVAYPPGLELREVNSRGKTVSSLMADTIEPRRMQRLYKDWNYSDYGGGQSW